MHTLELGGARDSGASSIVAMIGMDVIRPGENLSDDCQMAAFHGKFSHTLAALLVSCTSFISTL